jgi:lysyl-tRNA synthetase class 2
MAETPCWNDLAGRMALFEKRAAFLHLVRSFFRRRGFLEVDAPLLVRAAGMEPHLDAFAVRGLATGREAFLPTSPEFYLKKLLAGGARRCFSLSPSFRDEQSSRGHSPEFLMIEWYRSGETHERLLRDCAALLAEAGRRFLAHGLLRRGGIVCDFTAGLEVLTLSTAFRRFAGWDWLELDGEEDWRRAARAHGAEATASWSPTDCFSYLMVSLVEPRLAGFGRPVALVGYPAFQAALARLDPGDDRISERFELYAAGTELANAYTELTDAAVQRSRYEAYQAERAAQGKPPHPADEEFMDAVGHLPPCAGIALGADRLLALLLDEAVPRVRHGCADQDV